jgi:hypothetical protein
MVVENRFKSGPARELEFSNCVKRVEPISQFIGIARSKDVKPSKRLAETGNWDCPLAHSLGLLREQMRVLGGNDYAIAGLPYNKILWAAVSGQGLRFCFGIADFSGSYSRQPEQSLRMGRRPVILL